MAAKPVSCSAVEILQGTRFVFSFTTVTFLLAIYALEALVIFAAQRFIHRA